MRLLLDWLAGKATRPGSLVRHLARARDPEGFARLRALCDADPHVSRTAGSHTVYRAALLAAAKGGQLADITVGDFLELLDTGLGTLASVPGDVAVSCRRCMPWESSAPVPPRPCGSYAAPASAHPKNSSTATT